MRKHAEQFHLHLADPDVRRAAADELWAFSGDVALPGTNEALLWGHDAADVLPRLEKLNAHITAAHEAGFKAGQEAKAREMEEALRRQRHDDQRVWLEAFLPLLPEDKREQYREQIRIAQAAESLTPEENDQ